VPISNEIVSKQKQQSDAKEINTNSQTHHDIRNRLRLFRQFLLLNKNMNTSTHIAHEKFSNTDEVDEYCKKYCINSYAFLKENSSLQTSQVFLSNSLGSNSITTLDTSTNETLNSNSNSNPSNIENFVRIRSIIDKSLKFIGKEFNLQEFLINSNEIINKITSYNSIYSSSIQNSGFHFLNQNYSTPTSLTPTASNTNSNFGSSNSLLSNSQVLNNPSNNTYIDYLSSLLSPINPSYSASPVQSSYNININSISSNTSSNSSNIMSQLNITILTEPYSKQQSSGNSNRKKLEQQIVAKVSHVFSLFNSKTRIELIAIETPDNVIQCLAHCLRLEMEEQYFNANWAQFLEKLNNIRFKKQLTNFKLDELIHDLRYVKKSKVFVFYSLKSDQFKLLVAQ
jgi:hypothetical protein